MIEQQKIKPLIEGWMKNVIPVKEDVLMKSGVISLTESFTQGIY
jgi:hypothetical protein